MYELNATINNNKFPVKLGRRDFWLGVHAVPRRKSAYIFFCSSCYCPLVYTLERGYIPFRYYERLGHSLETYYYQCID